MSQYNLNKIRVWRGLAKKDLKIVVAVLAIVGVVLMWHGNSVFNDSESREWRNFISSNSISNIGSFYLVELPGMQWVTVGSVILCICAVMLWDLLFVYEKAVPHSPVL